jgi:hypothetical protein
MSKRMLITRPDHDDITFCLQVWSNKIIETANQRNIGMIDLKGNRVNKKNVESIIIKKNPRLIVFNGHGNDKEITGQRNQTLIKYNLNEYLLKSKITYAISCRSARKLGPKSVKVGALTYIGYEEDFTFYFDKNKSSRPLSDEIAKPFFESSNQVAISLLRGKTTGEAYNKSQLTFKRWIERFRKSKIPEAPYVLSALIWNMTFQKIIGDKNALI